MAFIRHGTTSNPLIPGELITIPSVNIQYYPSYILENLREVTLGDTHGNALKLLFCLIATGLIELDFFVYDEFVKLYQKEEKERAISVLTAEDLSTLDNIFKKISVKDPTKALRLVGDEVADRGANDVFNLALFERLHAINLPFEIIYSDHGMDFLLMLDGEKSIISPPYNYSGRRFFNMLNVQQKEEKEDVKTTIIEGLKRYYFPHLKLFSYSVTRTDCPANIVLFFHTTCDATAIKKLAAYFGTEYNDDSAVQLALSIDKINQAYADVLQDDTKRKAFLKLYLEGNEQSHLRNNHKVYDGSHVGLLLHDLAWQRYKNPNHLPQVKQLPGRDYSIFYEHGHTCFLSGFSSQRDHVINLDHDNELGKSHCLNKGNLNYTNHEGISALTPGYRELLTLQEEITDSEALKARVVILTARLARIYKQLNMHQDTIFNAMNDLRRNETIFTTLTAELSTLRSQIDMLSEENKKIPELKAENTILNSTMVTKNEQVSTVKAKLYGYQMKNETLVRELKKNILQLTNNTRRSRKSLAELKKLRSSARRWVMASGLFLAIIGIGALFFSGGLSIPFSLPALGTSFVLLGMGTFGFVTSVLSAVITYQQESACIRDIFMLAKQEADLAVELETTLTKEQRRDVLVAPKTVLSNQMQNVKSSERLPVHRPALML